MNEEHLLSLMNETCALVGIIHVHNETGVVNDLQGLAKKIRQIAPRCHIHSDGVQAIGKVDCRWIGKSDIDSYAFSSHKIGGYGGIGALYLRAGRKLKPFILGGSQEFGWRAGTENLAGIISLGIRAREIEGNTSWLGEAIVLGNHFRQECTKIPGVHFHGLGSLPTCSNFHIDQVKLGTILADFKQRGICAAAGAAFSATEEKPSATLLAMGYPTSIAGNSIRVSFGRGNTHADVEVLLHSIRHLSATARPL